MSNLISLPVARDHIDNPPTQMLVNPAHVVKIEAKRTPTETCEHNTSTVRLLTGDTLEVFGTPEEVQAMLFPPAKKPAKKKK